MSKGLRLTAAGLAILLLITAAAIPVFAQKTDKKPEEKPKATEPVETTVPAETTAPTGEPFSGDTDLITKDLMYDKEGRKQFISVQDRDGNLFYIVIDYDAPVSEEEEQYKTYFLNPVDPEDLAALTDQEDVKPAICICTEKCRPGQINLNCPVCAVNVTECAGAEPTIPQKEPVDPVEPEKENPTDDLKMKQAAVLGGLLFLIVAGGVVVIVKATKGKKRTNTDEDPDDLYPEEPNADNPEIVSEPDSNEADQEEDEQAPD